MDKVILPGIEVPSYRTMKAIKNGCENNILFTTWGGIGDQICAEPTLRFALDTFKGADVSIATELPELFSHLKFKKVYDLKKEKPDYNKYLKFDTINNPESLTWEFVSHCVTHCVDFPTICSLRSTLPIRYKPVILEPHVDSKFDLLKYASKEYVVIHAGKHWESKTFPVEYWNSILDAIIEKGLTPILIGKETDATQGTVQTKTNGCIDLRNKLKLMESVYLLQHSPYLICNDSSPMHMAVTGNARIAFIASAKHQDYLYHWRLNKRGEPEWAWRMRHFNKGGIWDILDYCPNKENTVTVDKVGTDILVKWLPEPKEILDWILSV